jgi:acyl-CoA thioester hydrolase
MFNANKTELKSVMWSTFVHFNLLQQKREIHSEAFMNLFKSVVNPAVEKEFEQRISVFKRQRV